MAEQPAAAVAPALVLVSERGAEKSFPLDGPRMVVGRDEASNIVLQNAWISRRHASLRSAGEGWSVVDEGSTHLTYLNKSVLKERQEHPLTHGDHLCFGGKVNFVFLEREDQEALDRIVSLLRPHTAPEPPTDSYANQLSREVEGIFSTLKNRSADTTLVEQLNDRMARSVAELRCLYEVGSAINAETDLDKVLDLILTFVLPATGAERGFIMLLDAKGELQPVLARDTEQMLDESELTTFSRSIARRALEMGKPIVSKDTASDPDISSKSILDYQIRSAICAPLMAKSKPLGVLYVDAKQSLKEFANKDTDFFSALANQSAIAVENAQLMAKLKRANAGLQQKVREMTALFEVSQSLMVVSDMRSVLETILDKSIEVLGAERGSIMLFDEESDYLRVRVLRGAPQQAATEGIRLRRGEGIAGKVAETGQGIISNQGFQDPQFKRVANRERDVRQILCVPLTVKDSTLGVINLINKKNDEPFHDNDLRLLQSLASQAAVTIENNRLYNLSIYDGLTGVYVHRYFQAVLTKHFETARRYGRDLSLLLIDIDHFKKFNDTYGHQVGDMVLAEVAGIFKRAARVPDVVARYGGEEFAMILPETNQQGGHIFAERLRSLVETHQVQTRSGTLTVTVSIGVSSFIADRPSGKEEMIKFADTALYAAKSSGRNRAVSYASVLPEESALKTAANDEAPG